MKKSVLGLFSLLFINFASAMSLSDYLYSIDPSTIFLGAVFLIAFTLINYPLSKFFKDKPAIAGIIAFCLSMLIVYGINRFGLNLDDLLYGIGLNEEILYPVLFLALLLGAIAVIVKFSFSTLLLTLGVLFVLMGFFAEREKTSIFIGAILLILGTILWWRKRKKVGSSGGGSYDPPYKPQRDKGPGFFQRRREAKDYGKQLESGRKLQKQLEKRERKTELNRRKQQQKEINKAHKKAIKKNKRQILIEPPQNYPFQKKIEKKQKQQLEGIQKQREKQRTKGMRNINSELKTIQKQLNNRNISEESKQILSKRKRDLLSRRDTLKRFKA